MKGGLGNMMKQAQMMQENLRKAQEELARIEVTGSAGGGLVSVVMTCRHDVKRVQIDATLLQDDAAQGSAGGPGGGGDERRGAQGRGGQPAEDVRHHRRLQYPRP